jgi:2-polyprenyl-3-methyl-5-hydroxy-6-metoxy-1,4-benzoquinol methylase
MKYDDEIITGNFYNKYETTNIIEKFLVDRYKRTLLHLIKSITVNSIYEVGSGEGEIINIVSKLNDFKFILGSDIDKKLLTQNTIKFPYSHWILNKAEQLPLRENSIDLVIACEVLEHISSPEDFLEECKRLNAKYYLFSIPNEPLWRILNMMRLKYLSDFGNTPGHNNHWSKFKIRKLVSQYLDIKDIFFTQPWIFILAQPYNNT